MGVVQRLYDEPSNLVRLVDMVNEELAASIPDRRLNAKRLRAEVTELEADVLRCKRRARKDQDDDAAEEWRALAKEAEAELTAASAALQEAEKTMVPRFIPTVNLEEVRTYLTRGIGVGIMTDPDELAGTIDLLRHEHGLRVTVLDRHLARIEMNLDPALLRGRNRKLRVVGPEVEPRLLFCVEVQVGEPRQTVPEWVQEQQGKHICGCGCGGSITILPKHHAPGVGIPKFIHTHHRTNMTAFVTKVNAEGLLTVSQAAAEVGVSENTLRRHAEALGVDPVWRSWGERQPMRLYRREDLPGVRQGLASLGFRFGDEVSYTSADVADRLHVSENTVRKWEKDGRIPEARRDTNGRRMYTDGDIEAIQVALADLDRLDQEVLYAEGVVTRAQAIELLGVGKTSMRRLVTAKMLVPREIVVPSSRRKVQVFEREAVEALRVWLDEAGRVVDAVRGAYQPRAARTEQDRLVKNDSTD